MWLNSAAGTLTKQSVIQNTTRNQREKATKLLLLYASEAQEVDELPFGSVGVILGLKHTRTGDTLVGTKGTSSSASDSLMNIIAPPPVMSTSVIPHSQSDLLPVQEALASLSRTDPSVRVGTHEGQLLVHGLGALHLEIVERRLREEWDANFEFGRQRVSYREGLAPSAIGEHVGIWNTEIAGKPTTIGVTLDLRPLEEGEEGDDAWDGNLVIDKDGKRLPGPDASASAAHATTHIARGLATTLSNSPHTSLPFARVRVEVKSHLIPAHVPPTALAGAAAAVLRDHLRASSSGPVMEPFVNLRITVPEDALGKIVKDLTECGGEVVDLAGTGVGGADEDSGAYSSDGVYVPPEWLSPSASSTHAAASDRALRRRAIHALAPLARMLDYSNRLRALSGGHGLFEMSNAGFKEVSDTRQLEILREIGRA
jgi:elongation factor G